MGSKKEECKPDRQGSDCAGGVLPAHQPDGDRGNEESVEAVFEVKGRRYRVSELTQVDVRSLPSLALEDRKSLPKVGAIYFAIAENNDFLYIGRSLNLGRRWGDHHQLSRLTAISNVRIVWLQIDDCNALSMIETKFIEYFNPVFNTRNDFVVRTREPADKRLSLRLFSEEMDRLRKYAKQENMTVTDVLKEFIRHIKINLRLKTMNIEFDIKELLVDIKQSIERSEAKLEAKFDNLESKFDTKIDGLAAEVSSIKSEVSGLRSEVKGISDRIAFQEFISRSVIGSVAAAAALALANTFINFFPH